VALRLHQSSDVSEATQPTVDRRRTAENADRRRYSRSGRRASDPHMTWRWRRLAWLFAGYAFYLSVRSLPASVKRLFRRTPAEPV